MYFIINTSNFKVARMILFLIWFVIGILLHLWKLEEDRENFKKEIIEEYKRTEKVCTKKK